MILWPERGHDFSVIGPQVQATWQERDESQSQFYTLQYNKNSRETEAEKRY